MQAERDIVYIVYTVRLERPMYYPTALEDAVPAIFIYVSYDIIHTNYYTVYVCDVHQSFHMKGTIPAVGQSVPNV